MVVRRDLLLLNLPLKSIYLLAMFVVDPVRFGQQPYFSLIPKTNRCGIDTSTCSFIRDIRIHVERWKYMYMCSILYTCMYMYTSGDEYPRTYVHEGYIYIM